jgi:hypothetical protein
MFGSNSGQNNRLFVNFTTDFPNLAALSQKMLNNAKVFLAFSDIVSSDGVFSIGRLKGLS